jgi:mRNA interferase MazF
MVMKTFVPCKGDFISLDFNPQSGHEQSGRRPAIVVSNNLFNERTGLAIVCPITNTDRDWPLHIKIPTSCPLTGVIMVEQLKSVDYAARHAKLLGKAPQCLLNEVLAILDACIYDS